MKFMKRIRGLFIKQDGGKEVIDKRGFFVAAVVLMALAITPLVISKVGADSSVVAVADEPIVVSDLDETRAPSPISPIVSSLFKASEKIVIEDVQPKKAKPAPKQKLKYKAPQVIDDSAIGKLSMGAKLIGKLLTSIDTRESEQFYQVLLPYGGKGRDGEGIPKNTILFGTINYPNKGRKVFMQFSKALLPDGKEVELKAQALSAKDYSPGLEGKLHSNAAGRIASTLGLTMVSAFTDTLTEKQALGEGTVSPKSTAKDALYQGIAKASEAEAQRQMSELGNEQEYVTIPAGREMIINLLSTYRGEQ